MIERLSKTLSPMEVIAADEMKKRRFPVLLSRAELDYFPASIPWYAIDIPCVREYCEKEMGRSLERIAERGGMSPRLIYWLVERNDKSISLLELMSWIRGLE